MKINQLYCDLLKSTIKDAEICREVKRSKDPPKRLKK